MNNNQTEQSQSKIQPQSLCFKSAPNQERLYNYLVENKSGSTIEIRSKLSIGNVADTVAIINDKLATSNDPRTIICLLKRHVNKFGKTGVIGHYYIVNSDAANDGSL